jgi:hypothetical protein
VLEQNKECAVESQPLTPSKPPHIFDVVALATTACLVGTVVFIQVRLVPTYVTVMMEGGYPLPPPLQVATWVCNFTTRYVLAGIFFWALYALWRRVRTARPVAFALARSLAVVNVVAVLVLMGQVSGSVGFAVQGFKATRNVIPAQEQSQAKPVIHPSSIRR